MTLGIILGIIAIVALIASWLLVEPIDEASFVRSARRGTSLRYLLFLDRATVHIRWTISIFFLSELVAFGNLFLLGDMSDDAYQIWKIFSVASLGVLLFVRVLRTDIKKTVSRS